LNRARKGGLIDRSGNRPHTHDVPRDGRHPQTRVEVEGPSAHILQPVVVIGIPCEKEEDGLDRIGDLRASEEGVSWQPIHEEDSLEELCDLG